LLAANVPIDDFEWMGQACLGWRGLPARSAACGGRTTWVSIGT